MLWGVWAALQPNPKQPDSREKKVKLYWPLLGDFDWLVKWSVTCVMLTPCHTWCPPAAAGNFNSWRPVTLSLKGKKAMISWCVDVRVVAHALSHTVHICIYCCSLMELPHFSLVEHHIPFGFSLSLSETNIIKPSFWQPAPYQSSPIILFHKP